MVTGPARLFGFRGPAALTQTLDVADIVQIARGLSSRNTMPGSRWSFVMDAVLTDVPRLGTTDSISFPDPSRESEWGDSGIDGLGR